MALETKVEWYGNDKKKDINLGSIIALTRSINIVQTDAKTLVPVDQGILRGSIVKAVEPKDLEAIVSTNEEYAAWIEFGDKSTSYQGQPYMRPALFNNKDKFKKIFIDEVKKSVNN
jgi:phage gpG-like protein